MTFIQATLIILFKNDVLGLVSKLLERDFVNEWNPYGQI